MSGVSATGQPFQVNHYFPYPGRLERSFEGEKHYADIRKEDLLLVVRRIEPRPLPPRDQHRRYDKELPARKQYESAAASKAVSGLADVLHRPEDTRRKDPSTLSYLPGDEL